jgi:hypothetical protein
MIENSAAVAIGTRVPQLFSEIQQIYAQYKREVPRKRGPWPEAIQSRVLELWKLGIGVHEISRSTGLACQTMYSWRQRIKKKDPGFLPVPIIGKRRRRSHGESRSLVLSPSDSHGERTTGGTLTVVFPTGIRLEGVPADQAVALVRELSG